LRLATIALLCAVVALGGCQLERSSTATATTSRQPFDPAVVARTLTSTQPYIISILGDSTGNNTGEWVHRLSRRIADTYGRTVTVHDWDIDSGTYESQRIYGDHGAPVTVWNGSAPAKSAQYALQWYPQMAPSPVDLTIINHSHNDPAIAVEGVVQLVDVAYRNTLPGGGVAVTLQNPRTDSHAQTRQHVIDTLRGIYSNPATGVVLLDVNSAFRAGNLKDLLRPDGIHPSETGSILWADTVAKGLELQ
jgi:lysophospholipase L1-like esterase